MVKLFKHQKKQNKKVIKALKKKNHILYGACTGFGKSVCLSHLMDRDLKKGLRVMVLAPYRKLIFQLEKTFAMYKPHVVMGTIDRGDKSSGIILSSFDTMNNRLKKGSHYFEGVDKIYIDEAHISCDFPPERNSRMRLLYDKYWDKIQWVGFTATPIKANGYRLDGWDKTIYEYQTPHLIEMGYLAQFKYFAPVDIDLSSMRTNTLGEYVAEDVEQVTNTPTAISSVKKVWKQHGKKRKVLIFASSIKHAELLADEISGSFIIHSNMSDREQMRILKLYADSRRGTLINVGMLTTGFDDPTVEMLIIARPIKSERLYIQVAGRVLRKYGDKIALIYDMCSCYKNCGLPSDIRDFNKVKGEVDEAKSAVVVSTVMKCDLCGEVSERSAFKMKRKTTKKYILTKYTCPCCGKMCKEDRQDLATIEKLKEVNIKPVKKLNYQERKAVVSDFVERFTKANPKWSHFIITTINTSDKGDMLDQIITKDVTDKTKWSNILKLYEESK